MTKVSSSVPPSQASASLGTELYLMVFGCLFVFAAIAVVAILAMHSSKIDPALYYGAALFGRFGWWIGSRLVQRRPVTSGFLEMLLLYSLTVPSYWAGVALCRRAGMQGEIEALPILLIGGRVAEIASVTAKSHRTIGLIVRSVLLGGSLLTIAIYFRR